MVTPGTVGWLGGSEQPGHSWKHAGGKKGQQFWVNSHGNNLRLMIGEDSPLVLLSFQHWQSN